MRTYILQTEGTLKPAKNFNAENDANILRKAMKGFGELFIDMNIRRCGMMTNETGDH